MNDPTYKTPRPLVNADYAPFYDAIQQQELRVQRCADCNTIQHPPGPMCPVCHSTAKTWASVVGRGRIHSYTVHYHPPLPGFSVPHAVVLVDMEEGYRLVGPITDVLLEEIVIDLAVVIRFDDPGDGYFRYCFVPDRSA